MPVLDGLGFLIERPKRNLAPNVPIVMITADDNDPRLLQAIAAGAQGFISKPFTTEQMQTRVTPFLHHAADAFQADRTKLTSPAAARHAIGSSS